MEKPQRGYGFILQIVPEPLIRSQNSSWLLAIMDGPGPIR
jgi:hypothetical protein